MIRWYWPTFLWALVILVLCGLPGKDLPDIDFWEIDIEDKLAHIGVFSILGFLAVRSRLGQHPDKQLTNKTLFIIIGLGVLYAELTEFLQGTVFSGRFASFKDFIADSIGMVLGTVFARWWFVTRGK